MQITADVLELSHRLLYHPGLFPRRPLREEELPDQLACLRRRRAEDPVPPRGELRRQAHRCRRAGIRALASGDPHYPAALELLDKPPPLIFLRGTLPLCEKAVALVGSRRCSRSGRELARRLGVELAAAGLLVVSGLARGIDAAAHEGALEGGCTLAVLGGGLDEVYPPEHEALARRVEERGALISEFPPGTAPLPFHFPRRNRIIAALAHLTVVVEAGRKSGALITAGLARDLGRGVAALPGHPSTPSAEGSNRLLFDGVDLVTGAGEILALLNWKGGWLPGRPWDPRRCAEEEVGDVETLALRAGWSLPRALRRLAQWESEGQVVRLDGGRFVVASLAGEAGGD